MKKEFFWAIKGFDNYFEGMYGMIEYEIFKGTEFEAENEGMRLSYEVISSYSAIDEYIEEEVRSECEFNGIDYDYDDDGEASEVDSIRSQFTSEDTAWTCTKLDESKLPTLDMVKLDRMFYDDPDEFLEKYTLKEGE